MWVGDGDLSEFERMEGQLLRFESENTLQKFMFEDLALLGGKAMESLEVGAYQRTWVVRSESLADL